MVENQEATPLSRDSVASTSTETMSYRQSLYPGASLSSSSATPSASAVSNLSDKQRQVQHFHQIHQHSQNLLQLYQSYADKYNVLVGGSECMFAPFIRMGSRRVADLFPVLDSRGRCSGTLAKRFQIYFTSTRWVSLSTRPIRPEALIEWVVTFRRFDSRSETSIIYSWYTSTRRAITERKYARSVG